MSFTGVETALEEKSKIAAQFIAQSPPGEVNDVISDIRAIIADDAALMPHVITEVQKYNITQLQVVEHTGPGGTHFSLLSKATVHPHDKSRFVDGVGKQSFAYDHITMAVSDYQPYELPEEEETFRAELAKSLSAYAKNHFPSGVSSVSCSQLPLAPPEPAPTPSANSEPAAEEKEIGAEAKVDAEEEAVKTEFVEETPTDIIPENAGAGDAEPAPTPLAPAPVTPATEEVDAPDVLEKVDEAIMEAKEEEEQAEVRKAAESSAVEQSKSEEEAESKVEEVEKKTEPSATEEKVEEKKEEEFGKPVQKKVERIENPKYTLEIVGNRYNPSNFWTGRWRTQWIVDQAASKVEGNIFVDVHYYEQGNVQLTTEHKASFPLPEATGSQSVASQIVTTISKIETAYQMELNDVYTDLSEKTFRSLRRVLPVTRQKIDWDNVAGYSLGADLRK